MRTAPNFLAARTNPFIDNSVASRLCCIDEKTNLFVGFIFGPHVYCHVLIVPAANVVAAALVSARYREAPLTSQALYVPKVTVFF